MHALRPSAIVVTPHLKISNCAYRELPPPLRPVEASLSNGSRNGTQHNAVHVNIRTTDEIR